MARLLDPRRIRRFLRLVSDPSGCGRCSPEIGGGCRKVRWSVPERGKRGGVRVIHFNRLADGHIWLLVMYAKNARTNIGRRALAKIRETINAKDD